MNSYSVINSDGVFLRSGALLLASDIEIQPLAAGESMLMGVNGRPGVDRWDGSRVVAIEIAPLTLAERKAVLVARLALRRWEVETAGIEFAGVRLETDDRSKLLVVNAARKARETPGYSVRWKVAPGLWVVLDAATLLAAEAAVFEHVQVCFAREAALTDLIEAADGTGLDALSAAVEAFWP